MKKRQLLGRFHPFRHNFQPQPVRQGDNGVYNSDAAGSVRQVHDECSVDLEYIDWKLLQIAERRITSAKIINGDPGAGCLKRIQHCQIIVGMMHQGAFGQLQLQTNRIETVFGQRLSHQISQLHLLELATRQVDRDPQPRKAAPV